MVPQAFLVLLYNIWWMLLTAILKFENFRILKTLALKVLDNDRGPQMANILSTWSKYLPKAFIHIYLKGKSTPSQICVYIYTQRHLDMHTHIVVV